MQKQFKMIYRLLNNEQYIRFSKISINSSIIK